MLKVYCILCNIPGAKPIIDFKITNGNVVVTLSKDGVLSCLTDFESIPRLLSSKRISLKDNEVPHTLTLDDKYSKIVVGLLREKDEVVVEQENNKSLQIGTTSLIDILVFDVRENYHKISLKFNKAFKVISKVEEKPFFIELETKYNEKDELLLFLMFKKLTSEVHTFFVGDKSLNLINNFKTGERVVSYDFCDQVLWLLDTKGIVNVFN